MFNNDSYTGGGMMEAICTKYGCDFALDLDGQITCTNCGGRDEDRGLKDD